MASAPTIYYFDVKARAEPLKVALSGKGIPYKVEHISLEQVKNLEEYPFSQAPRYKDDSVDLVQTNAILRHIGRKLATCQAAQNFTAKKESFLYCSFQAQSSDYLQARPVWQRFAATGRHRRASGSHSRFHSQDSSGSCCQQG